jgi:hypothetical protein
VQHQAGKLSPAEVRGYVRARGVAIVETHLVSASARHEVLSHLRPQLHALTVEALIHRVQGRVRANTGQRQLRRAA